MARGVEELKARLAECGPRRRGRLIGSELRCGIAEYAERQRRAGFSLAHTARELDVALESLRKWTKAPAFVPVTIRDPQRGTYVVVGGSGVRVEGLSLTDVAELLRRLS